MPLGLPIQPWPMGPGSGVVVGAPPPSPSPAPSPAGGGVIATQPQLPIWIYPGAPSFPIEAIGFAAMPVAAASVIIVQALIPAGFNAVIWQLANTNSNAGFVDGDGTVIWTILVNGVAYRGLEQITASLGAIAAPSRLVAPIFVKEQQVVALSLKNISEAVPAGKPLGGRLSGYAYPKDMEMAETWY
jgi:hypothetical protein